MSEIAPPPPAVLEAFSATGSLTRLPGGEGSSFATAQVVLKPTDHPAAATWIAETTLNLGQQGFRLARPLSARNGLWIVDGWTASERISGEYKPGRWQEIFEVSDALHAALAHLPAPSFLDQRSDPWAVADRVVWANQPLDSELSEYVELLQRLLAAREPLPPLSSQVIHADLAGNILFADDLPPAVISPYFRPAAYAKAIVAFDALAWEHADLDILEHLSDVAALPQLLIRAAAFRVAAAILLSQQSPQYLSHDGTAQFQRVIQQIL